MLIKKNCHDKTCKYMLLSSYQKQNWLSQTFLFSSFSVIYRTFLALTTKCGLQSLKVGNTSQFLHPWSWSFWSLLWYFPKVFVMRGIVNKVWNIISITINIIIGMFVFPVEYWHFVSKIILTCCEKKIVLVIQKNFWNSRLKAENLQKFFWITRTIFFSQQVRIILVTSNFSALYS